MMLLFFYHILLINLIILLFFVDFFQQTQISFYLRKINKYFPEFVSIVHAHISPLDIEMFDVSLTCMVGSL